MSKLLKVVGLFAGLALSTPTWALYIDGTTDVGDADIFIASTNLANSGDAYETAWVNSVLGTSYVVSSYYHDIPDGTQSNFWTQVDGTSDTYAYEFDLSYGDTEPTYYFLKLGVPGKPGVDNPIDSHYLFRNWDEMSYAVVNFGTLDMGDLDFNIGRISHIAGYGSTSVPEPASIALMGLGLIGMGVATRRRKQS